MTFNRKFEGGFSFQPSPTAPSMSFTGQSSTVGKTIVTPKDFAFFKEVGEAPITTNITPEAKKKNNKKKKKAPKDCNRPDCGEFRTKNKMLEKKVDDLTAANVEKIVHVREKQDEIGALKDHQEILKMALQERFDKAELDLKENDRLRKEIADLKKEHSEQMEYAEAENAILSKQVVDIADVLAERDSLREEVAKLKEDKKEHFTQMEYTEGNYSRLEREKARWNQQKEEDDAEIEKLITRDEGNCRHIEYLEKKLEQLEGDIERNRVINIEKDNDIKKKDRQIQDLHDSHERSRNEFQLYENQISALQADLAKARKDREALKEQVRAEKLEAKTARNDLDDHVKNTRDVVPLLERRNEEVRRLHAELEPLKEQLKGMEELRIENTNAKQTVAALSALIEELEKSQTPGFKQDPDAYRIPDTGSADSGDESVGDAGGESVVLKKKGSLDKEISIVSGEHESQYNDDLTDEKGNGHGRGPRNAFTQFIFKTIQVAVPGPEVVVEVPTPGPEVPVAGPTRYVPFRVWAHHPVVCWLLVEFNFLMLVIYWISSFLEVGKRLGLKVLGRAAEPTSLSLSDASESSEQDDLDGDGVRFPPVRGLSLQRSLWDDLLRPRPGRLPSTVDTLFGLFFHLVVYAAVWMSYSAYQERQLWLAANDTTRRYLHQILNDHQSDGFLGLKHLVPRGVQRKFVQWRFILFMKAGFPVAYRFPG
ncbi:hypothetical protein ACMFMG_002289 [Clarireedia jacksonii]